MACRLREPPTKEPKLPDQLTVCSTFSGVGGMDLGLERAGMRVVMSCEFVPWRRRILQQHWPDVPCCPDIRLLHGDLTLPKGAVEQRDDHWFIGPVDLLCGGFPCQPYSVAGKRMQHDDERALWPELERLLAELRPELVLFENVPGLMMDMTVEEPNDRCVCGWPRGWRGMHLRGQGADPEARSVDGGEREADARSVAPGVRGDAGARACRDGEVAGGVAVDGGSGPGASGAADQAAAAHGGEAPAGRTCVEDAGVADGPGSDDGDGWWPSSLDADGADAGDGHADAHHEPEPAGTRGTGGLPDPEVGDDVCPSCGRGVGDDADRVVHRSGVRDVLGSLAHLGFHDVAWRVLDSRHFGVPQRRRRVFVVGRRARGRFCASVLLELDGGVGDPAPRREAWAAASGASRSGVASARRGGATGAHVAPAVAATLTSAGNHPSQPGRRKEDDYNLVTPAVTAKWRTGSGGPAGDECQNLVGVDDRSVSDRIDDGDLAQGLTTTAFNGWDAKQAEANWVVPVGQGPNANDPDVAGTLGAFGKTGGHKQDLDAAGAYVIDPGEPHAGPVLTGSGGGRTTDLDGVGYAVRRSESGASAGHPDDARRGDGDAAGEHGGRPVGQDADGVREAARGEHGGRPRDVGGRRHGEEPELDGAGGDERGARDEPGAARVRARDERGARALPAPADGEGDGDGATPDTDGVRAAAGLPRRLDRVEGADEVDDAGRDDPRGVSRKRDAGLGVINDGTSYSLKTGAPVIGPVDVYDEQNDRVVDDVGTLTAGGLEAQNRGFIHEQAAVESGPGWWTESEEAATLRVDGDPATVVNEPEAFLPRHFTRGKDGAPSGTVPSLTSEMDRGDGDAMVHQPGVGFTSTLGSLDSDGIEIDGCPPIMARTPPAAAMPTMFDASSTHGHEGVGTGRPNMAAPGESLALTSRADRYAMFGLDRHGPGEDDDCFPTCPYDPAPDGARYAAMGDAVTVNVLHWIGAGIVAEAEAHGGLHNVPTDQGEA